MSKTQNPIKRNRQLAFATPAPEGWKPAFHEEVFLPPRSPFKQVSRGVVTRLLNDGVVVVDYYYGRHLQKQIAGEDLRPTGFKVEFVGLRGVFVRTDGKPESKKTVPRHWNYRGI